MSKSNKNNNNVVNNTATNNVPEVPTPETKPEEVKVGFGTKVKNVATKYGKPVLKGVGLAIGGAIAFGLGAKFGSKSSGKSDDGEVYDYAGEDYAAVESEE